ncbi:hypothetical protein N7510_007230 [Penicillium lagena]|uniref:uncharacterized protein n=1 Tax=Penicillium lagena TaxID=94218 RepID=UPI002541E43B|nr:uncharacterized protein N7510_007230 [Penicillium lagena]KAJ5610511.1 hypothetical protein N7510_007230 [Penicillium lagena]
MSRRPNQPSERYSMPPTDASPRDSLRRNASPSRSGGGSFRRAAPQMTDDRASGTLEGSTLGSSSREGDRRRISGQHRTQNSGSFLLDSPLLPRTQSARVSSYRPAPSEPRTEKRHTAPDPDIAVPKKRSRFPWSRHKNSSSEAPSTTGRTTPGTVQQTPTSPPDVQPSATLTQPEARTNDVDRTSLALDRDSLQIVTLALNLNESRRRTASGLAQGSVGRRPSAVSQPAAPVAEPGANQATQMGMKFPVLSLLPATVVDDHRAYEFSESTIARADRARRHFDLFYEYQRLLLSLPPLPQPSSPGIPDYSRAVNATRQANRAYNPLQMIRNRRVRYREKCSIDPEAEGWHDVDKVRDWVSTVEDKFSQRVHDHMETLSLPSFQQGQRQLGTVDADDLENTATSPPSSLRRISRTNSLKTRRPRLDWEFSPAELLADTVWVEDVANKVRIVDRDGNKLYSGPTDLALDTHADSKAATKSRQSVDVDNPETDHSSRRNSLSILHPALEPEFKSVGRGRQKHKYRGHSRSLTSRSVSSEREGSRWDRIRRRRGSVSSISSAEVRSSVDKRGRPSWTDDRKDSDRPSQNVSSKPSSRPPRVKSPILENPSYGRSKITGSQSSGLPRIRTSEDRPWKHRRQESFSSTGSLDDRYKQRMSLEERDSTAPSSPVYAGYFPSIAANLSPPSSRSPSPTKNKLRHKIVSRHESSKKEPRDRITGDIRDTDALRRHSLTSLPEHVEGGPKLAPSPLPDVVSTAYHDDENNRVDLSRARKGAYLPDVGLRGIFKGPGRIAEIVGNEVSKVGDLILKKEQSLVSKNSSSATPITSDDSDLEDGDARPDRRSGPKALLRRFASLGEEPGRPTREDSDKAASSRNLRPTLPTFTSPLRQDGRNTASDATDPGSPRERVPANRILMQRSKTIDYAPPLSAGREHGMVRGIKDPSDPFSLTRPPVTGLAKARASLVPQESRPRLTDASRAWSISDRSLHTLNDYGVPGKAEIERTRALLLSSGIKAREITRRAHTVREPPPWVHKAVGSSASMTGVTRLGEFDLAAQNLLRRFEMTQYSFQQSMHHFSTATSSPLRTQLKNLESLVNQTLTPRVRATASEAEDLCVQLNTTNTLAVKQLSDALDIGVRRRRRRLRWVRRTGFVVLEWALVGMLWWVWLIVMAFKIVRGVFRGSIAGAKWVLWL